MDNYKGENRAVKRQESGIATWINQTDGIVIPLERNLLTTILEFLTYEMRIRDLG